MNSRILKFLGLVITVAVVLTLGTVIGGGVVYALTQQQAADNATTNTEPGIVISSVIADSPAALAGVKRGNILLHIDGQPVNRVFELISYLKTQSAGNQVQLTVLHGDDTRTLIATLGEHNGNSYLGIIPCGSSGRAVEIIKEFDGNMPGKFGKGEFSFAAKIVDVTPNSPAAIAGLQPGHIITAVNDQALDSGQTLTDAIAQYTPGDTITLTVAQFRESTKEVTVQLAENSETAGEAYLGVQYKQIPDKFRPENSPHAKIEQGLRVKDVKANSPATQAGLTQGDVITAIDTQPVQTPRDLHQAVAAAQVGDTIILTITGEDGETSRDIAVAVTENPDKAGQPYLGLLVTGFFKMSGEGFNFEKEFNHFMPPHPGMPRFNFNSPFPFGPEFDFEHQFEDCPNCDGNLI